MAIAVFSFLSCDKYNEAETVETKEANSTLTIRTRANADNAEGSSTGEAVISYPVNIYVFEVGGECVETTSIAQEASEGVSLKLPEGSYNVYAIAGASSSDYDLPSKENATEETVISLKSGKAHRDLMCAQNRVDLSFGEENKLTLSLSRKVMLLESVTIKGVPSSVTGVSVTISPIYENIKLDGSYDGENGMQTVNLAKGSDGTTWTDNSGLYLLEASGPATIKVSLKTENTTTSYSYSSNDELNANYKINITGTYTGGDLTLSGTLTGVTWNDTKNIVFNFDESGSTTEEGGSSGEGTGEEGTTPGGTVTGEVPAAGTDYKGCYVLRSEQSGNNTIVTLMSADYRSSLIFDADDVSSVMAAIEQEMDGLANKEIPDWRLPTLEEMEYIMANITEINNKLKELELKPFYLQSNYYYFLDGNVLKRYCFNNGDIKQNFVSEKNTQNLRIFTTLTFAN